MSRWDGPLDAGPTIEVMRTSAGTALAVLMLSLLAACGADESGSDGTESDQAGGDAAGASGECEYPSDGQDPAREVEPPPASPERDGDVAVTFETSVGSIGATLDAEAAPCTVNSFASLAEQGFYDDSPCPRLANDPGFGLLQCGDPTGTGSGGPGYSVADELDGDETYPAGSIAMANAGSPDTNGSQWFFVFADTQLPPQYTVFGQLDDEGVATLQKVGEDGHDGSHPAGGGVPNTEVDIASVTVG